MRYLASFLLLGASCCSLVAQNTAGTGSITGLVTDSTDSVIPGATVTVENPSKGIRRELTTTEGGVFNAPSLVPVSGQDTT
jgi:hypothetical protein